MSIARDANEFRLRGTDVTRIESLSDVVFGFALTLLVVSLEVPKTYAQLIHAMRAFPAFAVCFWMLILLWRDHHRFFRRYGLHDERIITLNSILLFLIVFYVFPLKFLFYQLLGGAPANDWNTHIEAIMLIYALGFAAVYAMLTLMHLHAYSARRRLELTRIEIFDTRSSIGAFVILTAIGIVAALIAIALGPIRAGYSGWTFLLIPFAQFGFHRAIGRRRREIASETLAATKG